MNELTVYTRKTPDPKRFEVSYANGVQRQGTLMITVPAATDRAEVVAELGALHHLLVAEAVFGDDRAGNNLQLTVSCGQTKKLLTGRSGMLELMPWAGALIAQFAGASVTVESRSAEWEKPRRLMHVAEITLPDRLDAHFRIYDGGTIRLSMHALEQFATRANQLAPHDAWRQIKYMLSPALKRVIRNERLYTQAAERHGIESVIYYAPATHWNLVVALPSERFPHHTIVTMYYQRRKPDELSDESINRLWHSESSPSELPSPTSSTS